MKTKILYPSLISAFAKLNRVLKSGDYSGAKFFILVDENTYNHCLPVLIGRVPALESAEFFEVPVGEEAKSLEVAGQLWSALLDSGADLNSVIINLGGGCVSDIGGFVAAGFKGGIRYINVPTTVIGMVDAAFGGKTAVNVGAVKNQVRFFYQPSVVCICPQFLSSLPEEELRSGLFEMVKTLLLCDGEALMRLESAICSNSLSQEMLMPYIAQCADFKCQVTKTDPLDRSVRKMLNLGHTFGHGIEAFMLEQGTPLSHGFAVGVGLACALYLSVKKLGMRVEVLESYCKMLRCVMDVPRFTLRDAGRVLEYMRQDKKNRDGLILCVLLQDVGVSVIDVAVSEHEVLDALLQVSKEA